MSGLGWHFVPVSDVDSWLTALPTPAHTACSLGGIPEFVSLGIFGSLGCPDLVTLFPAWGAVLGHLSVHLACGGDGVCSAGTPFAPFSPRSEWG